MGEDEAMEGRIGRKVAEAYRATATPSPDARARLLARIAGQPAPGARGDLWARLTGGNALAPQRVALAAGCVLVAVAGVTLIGRTVDPGPKAQFGVGHETGVKLAPPPFAENPVVRFELAAPEAGRVTLVGDFNGWDRQATPMRRAKTPGSWTVSVPLERGRHAYGFVVDGVRWVPDPMAPLAPADGFGGVNSIIVVDGRGAS